MSSFQTSTGADSHPASVPQQRAPWFYLLPILLVPVLLMVAAWLVLPTQWFRMRSQNTYLPNLGYGATLHGRTCQILIYGDSTAMAGLDPRLLEKLTGLKTCNIAEAAGVVEVAKLLPVDDFLAHNPRPRYIVFYLSPFNFDLFAHWNEKLINTGEGISYLIEHQSTGRAVLTLAAHPEIYASWSESGMRFALQHIGSKPFSPDVYKLRADTGGRFVYPNNTRSACEPSTDYRTIPDPAFISYMRTHYATGGTQVLVDAAPTATCDPNLAYYREHVLQYVDNKSYPVLPLSAFSAEGHMHPNEEGMPQVTAMVASQITALAHAGGGN